MDLYTTLIWSPLCAEVLKLKVERRREPAERIAAVVNAAVFPAERPAEVTPEVTLVEGGSGFPADPVLIGSMLEGARRGTRTPTSFETRS